MYIISPSPPPHESSEWTGDVRRQHPPKFASGQTGERLWTKELDTPNLHRPSRANKESNASRPRPPFIFVDFVPTTPATALTAGSRAVQPPHGPRAEHVQPQPLPSAHVVGQHGARPVLHVVRLRRWRREAAAHAAPALVVNLLVVVVWGTRTQGKWAGQRDDRVNGSGN